jgi:uncharacterized protein (DUF2141 family)
MTQTTLGFVAAFGLLGLGLPATWQQTRDTSARPVLGTAAIVGHVVTDDGSLRPVRRARVVLSSADRSSSSWSATTDDAGRFVFSALPGGRYTVNASKPGWTDGRYGAKRPGRPGTALAVRDGESLSDVTIKMMPGAVLTGVVRDRHGQPVAGVIVSAMRFGYSPLTGLRSAGMPTSSATQTTDDRGAYRIYGLPPGDYALMATYRPRGIGLARGSIRQLTTVEVDRALQAAQTPTVGQPVSASPGESGRGAGPLLTYAPVFYPGTTDAATAGTIALGPAEERSGLDFSVPLVQTAAIDGAVEMPAGVAAASVQLWLLSSTHATSTLGTSGTLSTTTRLDAEGKFRFPNVAPGPYTILARAAAPRPATETAQPSRNPPPATLYASADVDVLGDQTLTLDLQPGVTISGRVVFDGAAPLPSPGDLSTMQVRLTPAVNTPALTVPPIVVDGQGAFQTVGVVPGTYKILYSRNMTGTFSARWTLNSVATGGNDVFDSLVVRPNQDIRDLTLTFTDHPSELSGMLQDRAGQAAPDYFIVVFAADRSFWTPGSRGVRVLRPGTDGGFSMLGLPAGEYYIGALTDVEDGEWYDPAFLDKLMPSSLKVTVVDGQKTTQNLRVGG